MTQWKYPDPDEAKSARIKTELEAILRHLGPEAPDPSTEIGLPQINKDGMILFIIDSDVYTLDGDKALRYRPSRDGNEDATYWRNGVQVRHIVNPPCGSSN